MKDRKTVLEYDSIDYDIKQSPAVTSIPVASVPKHSLIPALHRLNTNNS